MEQTLEEKVPAEAKVQDDDQGGTGRRLRDRDLLRKRKAEAEERVTNQWVYGAQSSKRAKRETNNVPKKKGRPRKNVTVKEQQPETTEVQDAGEIETPSQSEEPVTTPHPAPVSTLESSSIPAQVSPPTLENLPQISASASALFPLLGLDVTPAIKPSSEALQHEVLIEDLGPDEEDDKNVPQSIDQGGAEGPSDMDGSEQSSKVFSDTVLGSHQPDSLPGNLL